MDMTAPAGVAGTLYCTSGLVYSNVTAGATINVNPADVPELTAMGFTPSVTTTNFPVVEESNPPIFTE